MYKNSRAEKSQPKAERKSSILVKLDNSEWIGNILGNWTRSDVLIDVL